MTGTTVAPTGAEPDPMPTAPVEFHQMFRNSRNRWWRGVVAIVVFVVGYLIISTALGLVAIAIDVATGRTSLSRVTSGGLTVLTPMLLLFTNLTNFLSIPLSMLLQWWLWGQPVRWTHSVVGFIRWRLVARAAVVIVPVWFVFGFLPSLLGPRGPFTGESVALLLIVLLTTPLQAAGEEYGARGLINRAAASWVGGRRWSFLVGSVVSSALFCWAHGAGDPWLIAFYFLFGVAMTLIVWRTGGLEVSSLLHASYNMMLFFGAIAAGQTLSIDRSAGTGSPVVLLYLVVIGAILAVVWWRGKREEVQRTYQPPSLARPVILGELRESTTGAESLR